MSYYDDEDELDIRVRTHGRASPVVYPDPRSARPVARPVYYQHGSSYLVPEASGAVRRSRSTSRRRPSPPPLAPVIINNYNDYDSEEAEEERYLRLAAPVRSRSRSRSRHTSLVPARDDYQLEKTRRELEAYKLEAQREEDEKRLKQEMELQKLRDDRRAEDERRRIKRETEEAVEKFKIEEAMRIEKEKRIAEEAEERFRRKEAERVAKEKKEKEEREEEYKRRLEEDLRRSGMDERQIAIITKKDQVADPNRPTYTRMSRKYLSIETLNRYRIDYEFDTDPDYVLIKRWVPEYEQDFLWNHTREIRERRGPVVAVIEGKKKHHHETEFEFVRKKKERKPSPSPLLTFLAGGKR